MNEMLLFQEQARTQRQLYRSRVRTDY